MKKIELIRVGCVFVLFFVLSGTAPAAVKKNPITVNGDRVEFISEGREVLAQGNVEIAYQDSWMTCDNVRVFIDEKLIIAEGNVRFSRDDKEAFGGETVVYDFSDYTGTIINPTIEMEPYYGTAELMEKTSGTEYSLGGGVLSTCDLPHPHWFLRCKSADLDPNRILTARGVTVSVLDLPLLYIPVYSQRISDKRPRFMIIPGYKKEFGMELFGSWRYYLNEQTKGLLHFDWYQKKGWAQGIDLNYDTKFFGKGNAKYYRIDEMDTREEVLESERHRDSRSRIELRHKWQISNRDNAILEYFRESDSDFRKDYFLREYEKETNPKTYFLYSHVFPNATFSFLAEPRVNEFSGILQKTPELRLETVNQRIAQTRFYFKSTSTVAHLANTAANVGGSTGEVSRFDTSNRLSYIFRFMGLDFNPFIGHQDTYYSRQLNEGEGLLRGMFFTGMDISTRLYSIFDVNTNFMQLDINKLRHVISPSLQYRYQRDPTVNYTHLQQFDTIDALDRKNRVTFSLENKLQTKRAGSPVDLARLILSTDYNVELNQTEEAGFHSFRYELEFKPYSWWEFDSEAEFDPRQKIFKTLDADLWGNIGKLSASLGYRFKHDESSQLTAGISCTLNPFWKLNIYERFEYKTGNLVEQEYRLERDFHCWIMEFIVNQRESEGISILLGFKMKAFPEIGVSGQKTLAAPRSATEL